jgi:arabinose-5-phosphate isomerase
MDFTQCARRVFEVEIVALQRVMEALDSSIGKAVELIYNSAGKVVITGIGKAGIVGHKIASSMASTGTNAIFVNAAEAQHGDLGMVCRGDIIIAVSNSGSTQEILSILPVLKSMQCPIIAITGNVSSPLAQAADVVLDAHVDAEACPLGLAPTSSTTAELVIGDALTVCLIERRDFKAENFALYHPGGALGRKLLTQVGSVMRTTELPMVEIDTSFTEIIYEVTSKRMGLTLVGNIDGGIAGIITDGDIRRAISKYGKSVMDITAIDCMTKDFKSIEPQRMIGEALELMERHKIMALIILTQDAMSAAGILCMHDIIDVKK